MITQLIPACSGHLLVDLPVFMGPVLVLGGWLLVMTRRGGDAKESTAPQAGVDRIERVPAVGSRTVR